MRRDPIGIAEAGGMAGNVDQILHGERQAIERPLCRSLDAHPRTGQKGTDISGHRPKLQARVTGSMIECVRVGEEMKSEC